MTMWPITCALDAILQLLYYIVAIGLPYLAIRLLYGKITSFREDREEDSSITVASEAQTGKGTRDASPSLDADGDAKVCANDKLERSTAPQTEAKPRMRHAVTRGKFTVVAS